MSTAQEMVTKYLEAELAILQGKTVTFNGRSMGMEDLAEIRKGRQEWEQRVGQQTARTAGAPSIGGRTFSVASFGGGS